MIGAALCLLAVLLWPDRATTRAIVVVLRRAKTPATLALVGPRRASPVTGLTGLPSMTGPDAVLRRVLQAVLSRRANAPTDGVVGFLDALGAALGAGLTPADALRVSAPTHPTRVLDTVSAAVIVAADDGRPTGPVWKRGARRSGHPDLAALARAWTLSERLGCPLSDAVKTTTRVARTRTELQQRLDSATTGARMTCSLLSLLPVGGVGVALLLGIDPITLYTSPIAAASLTLGLVLLLIGRLVVRRMIAHVVRCTP